MGKNLYLHKTLISKEDLYVSIEDDFGFFDENGDELYDDYIFTCKSTYSDIQPINIDRIIHSLQVAQNNGANYVTLFFHEDHQEYEIESFLIKKSSEDEIEYFNEEKRKNTKHTKDSILKRHKKELEDFERLYGCPPEA